MLQSLVSLPLLFMLYLQPSICCPWTRAQRTSPSVWVPLSRYKRYVKTVDPGLIYVNPLAEEIVDIDCRISVIDLPKQNLMTKGTKISMCRQHPDCYRFMCILSYWIPSLGPFQDELFSLGCYEGERRDYQKYSD